jgi:glutamate-1-semialdehyde 2,1-aminomutase
MADTISVIKDLIAGEQARFASARPRSAALYARGGQCYLYGAPSHWMRRWAGGLPMFVESASGAHITDVDGFAYVDFALGDTGAMCGHANPSITSAVARQMGLGATMMLPTEGAIWVGEELQRRFGLPYWGFTTSATDANRACIRVARMITGRDKVLVFAGAYHGNVEEAHVTLRDGVLAMRNSIHPNGFDHARISKVVQFNDIDAVERALSDGDVACILTEPVMTNYGIIQPQPGFLVAVRALAKKYASLLIIDETHTISSGPHGYAAAHDLDYDMFVVGKAIGGGIPVAVNGFSEDVAARLWALVPRVNPIVKQSAHLGFGGTLAGGALGVAAVRAALEFVLTPAAFAHMHRLAERMAREVGEAIAAFGLPWHVTQVGGRIEYMFSREEPRDAVDVAAARDDLLELLLHVFFLNRGVILTPFHNMALMCPATSDADVDRHGAVFREFAALLQDRGLTRAGSAGEMRVASHA